MVSSVPALLMIPPPVNVPLEVKPTTANPGVPEEAGLMV